MTPPRVVLVMAASADRAAAAAEVVPVLAPARTAVVATVVGRMVAAPLAYLRGHAAPAEKCKRPGHEQIHERLTHAAHGAVPPGRSGGHESTREPCGGVCGPAPAPSVPAPHHSAG